jgi:hypothetical protein
VRTLNFTIFSLTKETERENLQYLTEPTEHVLLYGIGTSRRSEPTLSTMVRFILSSSRAFAGSFLPPRGWTGEEKYLTARTDHTVTLPMIPLALGSLVVPT